MHIYTGTAFETTLFEMPVEAELTPVAELGLSVRVVYAYLQDILE